MKTLLLIRHAKSDWGDVSLSDFDRPLNERGKRDAPVMAERLFQQKIKIGAIVSSPAKRAKKTASIFAKIYGIGKEDIILEELLYGATENVFFDVIKKLNDNLDHIAIFSHNPGITDFANRLADARIDNIPTCGVFAVKINCKKWADFKNASKEFLFFDYPKSVLPG